MVAGITSWIAAAGLAVCVAAGADNSPRSHEGRMQAAPPQVAFNSGVSPPPRAQVSPAAPEVTSPKQAAAARPRDESEPSPFTLAEIAPVALLAFVTVLGLVITFRSLRKDIRSRRSVYRERMHRTRSHP